MARLWQCGFELNSSAVGMELSTTSGSSATSSSVVRTGGYSLRINPTAGTAFVRFHVHASNQASIGYQRIYLNIASLPSATTHIMRFVDVSNNVVGGIRLTTAGKLQLLNAAGIQIGSDSATTLSTGSWYRIELANDATGAGALEAKLDGTTFASGANSAQGQWARILIGVIATSATADLYFDDWAINDNSGSQQNSWCGDGHIVHLGPNGTGDANAWNNTLNNPGGTSNYQLVDDISPPNDATDVAQSVTLNAEDMYAVTDFGISGATINCVMVGGRFRNNTADAVTGFRFQLKKTSGGTILQSATIVPNSASFVTNAIAEPRLYPIVTYADPDGAAWTPSTLDSMQIGAKIVASGTQRVQLTSVWASVDYTPGSGGGGVAVTGTAPLVLAGVVAAAKKARAAGASAAVLAARGTTTRISPAIGRSVMAVTGHAQGAKVAAGAGRGPLAMAGAATARKTAAALAMSPTTVTGRTAVVKRATPTITGLLLTTGTAAGRKASAAQGRALVTTVGRTAAAKTAGATGRAPLAAAGSALAGKTSSATGRSMVLLLGRLSRADIRQITALAPLIGIGTAAGTKTSFPTVRAPVALAGAVSARRVTTAEVRGPLTIAGRAAAAKRSPAAGRGQLALAGRAAAVGQRAVAGRGLLVLAGWTSSGSPVLVVVPTLGGTARVVGGLAGTARPVDGLGGTATVI